MRSRLDWDPLHTAIASEIGRLEVASLCAPKDMDRAGVLRCLAEGRELAIECDCLSDDLELRILTLEKAWGRKFDRV